MCNKTSLHSRELSSIKKLVADQFMGFAMGFWNLQSSNFEGCVADCICFKGAHVLRYRFWVASPEKPGRGGDNWLGIRKRAV